MTTDYNRMTTDYNSIDSGENNLVPENVDYPSPLVPAEAWKGYHAPVPHGAAGAGPLLQGVRYVSVLVTLAWSFLYSFFIVYGHLSVP